MTDLVELGSPYGYLLKLTGLTQQDFCRRAGFSRTTLQYLLAGQMNKISATQIQALSDACVETGVDAPGELEAAYGTPSLRVAYDTWKRARRASLQTILDYEPEKGEGWLSPFRKMVIATSTGENAFSRALMVPQPRVLDYAGGKVKRMPQSIRNALKALGYPYLELLDAYQTQWRYEREKREASRG